MTDTEKLKDLLTDVFLLEENEFSFNLSREQLNTWDSLGTVAMAVGIQDVFGYHMTPDEAMSINQVLDIVDILKEKGVAFNDQPSNLDS